MEHAKGKEYEHKIKKQFIPNKEIEWKDNRDNKRKPKKNKEEKEKIK